MLSTTSVSIGSLNLLRTIRLLVIGAIFSDRVYAYLNEYRNNMVSLHGHAILRRSARRPLSSVLAARGTMKHTVGERPPDPQSLFKSDELALQEKVQLLVEWFQTKSSVLCITGAGLSTESGIPDYRGNKGSYFEGHKPMIHQQFMESEFQRKRYWGRSMVGWSKFDAAQPNKGHYALASLERMGKIGVAVEDQLNFYDPDEQDEFPFSSGQQQVGIVTQNVDSLHQRAGSKHVMQLHGAGNVVKCMNCGTRHDRKDFTLELQRLNRDWLNQATTMSTTSKITVNKEQGPDQSKTNVMRPDGDAQIAPNKVDYNDVHVMNCNNCEIGFFKPDVVFFGDNVPKHRVALCQHAVQASDGILVVGTSLAVHSAFRHVKAASDMGIPIAILNVGETRAEVEGLDHILKIEAPAGDVLDACADHLASSDVTRAENLTV